MHHAPPSRAAIPRRALSAVLATTLVLTLTALTLPAGSSPIAAPRGVAQARRAPADATFDVRAKATPAGVSTRTAVARATLARSLGRMGVLSSDPTTGTLRFVGRLDGFLTGTSARPASSVVLDYVRAHLDAFGLRNADLRTLHLRKDYVDIGGTHHLSYVQRAGGLTLFGQGVRASVTSDGRLINVTGGPMRGLQAPSVRARISGSQAIAAARSSVGSVARDTRDEADLALFPTGRGARLAFRTVTHVSTAEMDLSFVDATSGEVLYRRNMTNAGTATTADTTGDQVWPFYYSSIPPNGGGVPVDDVDLGDIFTANPFPVGEPGPQLLGPNAWVFKDVKDDSFPDPGDAVVPTGGDAGSGFLFDYDPSGFLNTTRAGQNCSPERACTWERKVPKSWKDQLAHNAVQVFFFLNQFHDHLAASPIGFNDNAGNFEYGGTDGNDMVLGNASDGANTDHGLPDLNHIDNANMSTPPDGSAPTMQMYLFGKVPAFGLGGIPSANGGDDAEVVYHEYTHGLSNRLVIYPDGNSGLDNQQAGSMGEAWSDWYAEDFLNQQGYKPDTGAVGDVVMGELTFNSLLRTQPVDCPVGTVDPACPGGFETGPGGYTYGDFGHIRTFDDVNGSPEVHSDGEIWLETLWDIRQALPNTTARRLVTRGMELSPPSPSFLDMRNAIIQADVVENAGANGDTLWQAFADRGMGYFASSVGGGDLHPVEDFSLPPDCSVDPCHEVSGTVTDKVTGDPLEGATVGFSGLMSGFGFDLSAETASDGTYSIVDVPDHDAYAAFVFTADGYEMKTTQDVVVAGDVSIDKALFRDWAALSAGATLKSFTPPDYVDFCGTNANGAFDLNLGSGWPSDSVDNGDSGVAGPRRAIVRLPKAVDVTSFGVASGGSCGDDFTAGVKHFQIQTRTDSDAPWKTAVDAKAKSDGVLRSFDATAGKKNVRIIRFVMLSNHGDPFFMDVLEVTVRGA